MISAVVLIDVLAMTACSDTKHCYEFKTVTGSVTVTTYDYMTKAEADAKKADLDTSWSTCTYKRVSKSEADCVD